MDFNRRMRSSNVQGFASKVLTLYEEEMRRRRIRKRLCSAVRLYPHAQFNFYIVFLCNGIHNIPLLSAVTEKRVSVPEAHKIEYAPMHTIRVITRLAQNARRIDRASASSRLCLDYALASISCEHCHSSRNNPHYAPRHIIYY